MEEREITGSRTDPPPFFLKFSFGDSVTQLQATDIMHTNVIKFAKRGNLSRKSLFSFMCTTHN